LVVSNEDVVTRLMYDMPPELLELVRTKVNSFTKLDVVRFFGDNPNTMDTADNIATYVGRNRIAVEPELQDLVANGMMETQSIGGITVYALASEDETRELVQRFIAACEDRQFRVKVIYHIVRGMR
jgi:hypothetical protein